MPFYRYEFISPLEPQTILRRIGTLLREPPGFLKSTQEAFGKRPKSTPPFIGKVEGNVFHARRDIRYRNSFLPQVKGSVISNPMGSRVKITMHLPLFTAAFMLFWLAAVAIGAIGASHSRSENPISALILAGMLLFGVALTVGGFYPEAYKARRLLEQGIGNTGG